MIDPLSIFILKLIFVGAAATYVLSPAFRNLISEIVASIMRVVCRVVEDAKKWLKSVVCRLVKNCNGNVNLEVYTSILGLDTIKKKTQPISWSEIPSHLKQKLKYEGECICHEYHS